MKEFSELGRRIPHRWPLTSKLRRRRQTCSAANRHGHIEAIGFDMVLPDAGRRAVIKTEKAKKSLPTFAPPSNLGFDVRIPARITSPAKKPSPGAPTNAFSLDRLRSGQARTFAKSWKDRFGYAAFFSGKTFLEYAAPQIHVVSGLRISAVVEPTGNSHCAVPLPSRNDPWNPAKLVSVGTLSYRH